MAYPLISQRLSIEPLSASDLADFVAYRQDPEVARYQSWDTNYSLAQAIELLESQVGVLLPEPGNWLQLGVHNRTNNRLIGDIAIHSIVDQPGCFEIGFTLSRENQRKGYAFEAVCKLLEHLGEEGIANRFIATPDSRNSASVALLQTLGFEQDESRTWTEEFKGEKVTVLYFLRDQSRL